jgi:CheY-like chemotaxis protein
MTGKAAFMSQLATAMEDIVGGPSLGVGPTPHVLVADSRPATRDAREAQLKAAGFRVTTARTGFEAIVKASCHVPDLILLDDSLTDMDAGEARRLITTCPMTEHIPIICMTPRRRLPGRVLARLRRAG